MESSDLELIYIEFSNELITRMTYLVIKIFLPNSVLSVFHHTMRIQLLLVMKVKLLLHRKMTWVCLLAKKNGMVWSLAGLNFDQFTLLAFIMDQHTLGPFIC